MPHFYFNLYECGELTPDEEGRDVANADAARAQAIREAREIMCAEVSEGRLCLGCAIVVVDADGTETMRVPFRDAVTITGL